MRDKFEEILNQQLKKAGGRKLDAAKQVLRERLKKDLFALCYFLGYGDIRPHVHGEIVAALSAPTKRKLICVPRGTFKSSIGAIVYPIWRLIQNPDLRILIDSELYTNSVTYLRAIKTHLESEPMRQLFGEFKNDRVWREDAIQIRQRRKNLKEPSISAGGLGTTKVGQHYDLIIGDDYNSPENTANKERAQKVVDHYRYALAILDPGGEYVIIGTRYGENDLIGFVLRDILNEPKLAEGIF